MKLKVKAGMHRIGGVIEKGPNGVAVKTVGRNIKRGEVFESDKDLSKLFPEKFARVDRVEEVETEINDDRKTYEAMTVAELREAAEGLELEIPEGAKKADLVNLLLSVGE